MTNLMKIKCLSNHVRKPMRFDQLCLHGGIQTHQHAWLLGLAYGDGSIEESRNAAGQFIRFELSLQFRDIDVMEKITSPRVLGVESLNKGISMKWQHTPSLLRRRPQCRLSLYGSEFATKLNQLGCMRNKSSIIKFPHSIVPQRYMLDFIRGYFEADGSLALTTNGIVSIAFCAACHEFLNDLCIFLTEHARLSHGKVHRSGYYSQLCWSNKNDLSEILNLLYKDWDPHYEFQMNRKFARAQFAMSILHLPYKERMQRINIFKHQERIAEYEILCSLIEFCESAAQFNARVYKYVFTNSWLSFLELFALDSKGCLYPDWKQRVCKQVFDFR